MNHNTSKSRFFDLVHKIEQDIASFYQFEIEHPAVDFILPADVGQAGSQVVVRPEDDGSASIQIVIDSKVIQGVLDRDPRTTLDDINLNSFCVLVEELSHFHLIANRLRQDQPFGVLELEWHAEIDKYWICARYLEEHHGDGHLEALFHRLYIQPKITANDFQLYWLASKHAAQFWQEQHLAKGAVGLPCANEKLRRLLQSLYAVPGHGKIFGSDLWKSAA